MPSEVAHPGLATMPGNGGANENSHLAPDGMGPDYGKGVRNAFMAGDQQASRCVNVMSRVGGPAGGGCHWRPTASLSMGFLLWNAATYLPRTL